MSFLACMSLSLPICSIQTFITANVMDFLKDIDGWLLKMYPFFTISFKSFLWIPLSKSASFSHLLSLSSCPIPFFSDHFNSLSYIPLIYGVPV